MIGCFSNWSRVLHERKINVPPKPHEVDIEYLKWGWHKGEVDQLKNRPHFPVSYKCWNHLLFQFILGALKIFPFQFAYINVKACDGNKREDSLGEEHLLAQGSQIIAFGYFGKDLGVGEVQSWTVSEDSIAHEVEGTLSIKLFLSRHFYMKTYSKSKSDQLKDDDVAVGEMT